MTERADYLVNNRSPRYLHGFQKDTNETTELPHTVPVDNQVTYIDSFTNYGVDTVYGKEYVIAAGSSPTVHNSLPGRSDADTHPASSISNTPAGNIAATTVQAAINELDSEKGGLAQGNTWVGSNTFTQSLAALQFVKSGGTSGQFLKADGSVDSSSYETTITAGTTSQYYRGDKTWQALDTVAVTESTNLYFTNARVLSTVLTGLNTSLAGTVSASDTILAAIGKLENRVSGFSASGVSSFNTRTGAVTLTSGDVTSALGYTPSADTHVHTFASLTDKPTTLSGYGITDAASSTHNHDTVYAKLSGASFTGRVTINSGSASNPLFVYSDVDARVAVRSNTSTKIVSLGIDDTNGYAKFNSSMGSGSALPMAWAFGSAAPVMWLTSAGILTVNRQLEANGNGTAGGIILRNPSGDRYRLSINSSNALQLDAI